MTFLVRDLLSYIFSAYTGTGFSKHLQLCMLCCMWWHHIECCLLVGHVTSPGFKQKTFPPETISLIYNLIKLMTSDWRNGFVLSTVDYMNEPEDRRGSHQPRYLLTEVNNTSLCDKIFFLLPVHVFTFSSDIIHIC